jgi:flagellar biosynthesis regulator FlbT
MKKFIFSILALALIGFATPAQAQTSTDAESMFKKHINEMVESVEKAETSDDKRVILNDSFDDLISAIEKVESMKAVPESDKEGLAAFKADIQDKKDELNGINGFTPVASNNLNNFANFVQQDLEQADQITIGVTTLLLIIIILLLL